MSGRASLAIPQGGLASLRHFDPTACLSLVVGLTQLMRYELSIVGLLIVMALTVGAALGFMAEQADQPSDSDLSLSQVDEATLLR